MVTVVAIRAFQYGDRPVHVGEAVYMEAIEAAQYGFSGHVSLDPAMRATYQTRHLTSAEPTAVSIPPPATPLPTKKPSRRRRARKSAGSSQAA